MNPKQFLTRLAVASFTTVLLSTATLSYAQTSTPPAQTPPGQTPPGQTPRAQTPPGQRPLTQRGTPLTPEQRHERRMQHLEHMRKTLGLTDDQYTKIVNVMDQYQTKMDADRDAVHSATDRSARNAARVQLNTDRKAMQSEIKTILTPDQLKKFHRMPEYGWGNGRGGRGQGWN